MTKRMFIIFAGLGIIILVHSCATIIDCNRKVINRRGEVISRCTTVLLMALVISGCGVFDPRGGVADYYAKPYQLDDGSIVCCEIRVKNTKDIGSVVIHFEKDTEGYITLTVGEEEVDATSPAQQSNELIARLLEIIVSKSIP